MNIKRDGNHRQLIVWIPKETKQRLHRVCDKLEQSRTQVLNQIIAEFVELQEIEMGIYHENL